MTRIRYWVGRMLAHAGWSLVRSVKKRRVTVDPIQLAMRLIHASGISPVIVQLGAYDGRTQDPLYPQLQDPGNYRKAILVEPQQELANQVRTLHSGNEKIHVESCLLADRDGEGTLWIPPGVPSTVASTDPRYLRRRGNWNARGITVPCLTFSTLLAKHGVESMDLLQIDCEGADGDLVALCLVAGYRPRAIHFEISNLSVKGLVEVRQLLGNHNYSLIEDECDTLALHESLMSS